MKSQGIYLEVQIVHVQVKLQINCNKIVMYSRLQCHAVYSMQCTSCTHTDPLGAKKILNSSKHVAVVIKFLNNANDPSHHHATVEIFLIHYGFYKIFEIRFVLWLAQNCQWENYLILGFK